MMYGRDSQKVLRAGSIVLAVFALHHLNTKWLEVNDSLFSICTWRSEAEGAWQDRNNKWTEQRSHCH